MKCSPLRALGEFQFRSSLNNFVGEPSKSAMHSGCVDSLEDAT